MQQSMIPRVFMSISSMGISLTCEKQHTGNFLMEPGKVQMFLTGFYPKLKSFWSCSYMNCCQQYMLHINLHILYIYFIKFNLNLKEFQESDNHFKSYQLNEIEYFVELYFILKIHLNLNIKPNIQENSQISTSLCC